MKKKNNSLINIIAALITFIVQMFISFWLSPFIISKLGEESYGFINLANNFVSYASLIAVAINSMASRYISLEYNSARFEEEKKYYSTVFWANCLLFVIIIICSSIIVQRLDCFINISPNLVAQVKITFMLSFVNMGVSLLGTVYTAAAFTTNKMHLNSLIQIIANVGKSFLLLSLFTFLPAKIYYFSIALLTAGLITLIGNYIVSSRLLVGFKAQKKYFELKKIVILVKSGVWVLISNVSNILLNGFDLLLSNWFISSTIMGRLSLAKQIPYAFSSALGIFSNIFASSLTLNFSKEGYKSLVQEAKSQLKILSFIFTVPYAGIIVFGKPFLSLWLKNANYTSNQLNEIYVLMIIILLDIIVSTYMYSIHSVFIALDKVKTYSILLFCASIISVCSTIFLVKYTSLGVFAIAGTSTVVLGITHSIFIPILASKLLNEKRDVFLRVELKSWTILFVISCVFLSIRAFMTFNDWFSFFLNVILAGSIGYIMSLFLVLDKNERRMIITRIFSD